MCLNTHCRNYSGEQKVNFESPVPFSKCLRAKIYSNMNVYYDAKGCQTLLLKESEPLLFTLGSWTTTKGACYVKFAVKHAFSVQLNVYAKREQYLKSAVISWTLNTNKHA